MQFPTAGTSPRAPRAVAAARANSRQLHLHGSLPESCGTLLLAIAWAAASTDGTGSRALACARLHDSHRAAGAAHTGTRMRVAMSRSFHAMTTRPHGPMAIIISYGDVGVTRSV